MTFNYAIKRGKALTEEQQATELRHRQTHLHETSREFRLSNSPDPHVIEVREEAISMGRPSKPDLESNNGESIYHQADWSLL